MIYSQEVENMCPVAQGVHHGAAPIPEEAKWVQAKAGDDDYVMTRYMTKSVSYVYYGIIGNSDQIKQRQRAGKGTFCIYGDRGYYFTDIKKHNYHMDAMNMGYTDGHVSSIRKSSLAVGNGKYADFVDLADKL